MISFEVFGEKQVERGLLRFSDAAADMRPAAEQMRTYLLSIERRQFDTEGRSGSGGWAPLKPATLRRKVAKGEDQRILRATEALRKSLTNRSNENNVWRSSFDSFTFGTSDPKARFHQSGTAKMPQRKVIELSENNRKRIVKIFQSHLIGEVATVDA